MNEKDKLTQKALQQLADVVAKRIKSESLTFEGLYKVAGAFGIKGDTLLEEAGWSELGERFKRAVTMARFRRLDEFIEKLRREE